MKFELFGSLLKDNKNMAEIYVSNKGQHSLKSLVIAIIDAFLDNVPKNNVWEIFKNIFGNIGSLEYKDAKISFKPKEEYSDDIVRNFHYYLRDLINQFKDKNGIFLIIDDINGLSENKEFVNWYKRFCDTIEVDSNFNLNLYVLYAGYPEKFDNLVLQDESFGRIFHYDCLDSLSNSEVSDFFKNSFAGVGIKCEDEALKILTFFSSGSPLMMQYIGDAAFWQIGFKDNITKKDATIAIVNAANERQCSFVD